MAGDFDLCDQESLLSAVPDAALHEDNGDEPLPPACYIPRRVMMSVMLFFGLSVVYAMRVCISIAAVPANAANVTRAGTNATGRASAAGRTTTMYSEFGWTNTDQGIVLGAFFNGYIVTQIVGGMLSKRYGGRAVLLWSVSLAALLTVLTPLAAAYSFPLLVACRTLLGAVEGVSFPSTMSLLAEWTAPAEKAVTVSFVFAGSYAGNVMTFVVGGWLLQVFGWRTIFLGCGSVGILWAVLFYLLTSSTPEQAVHHRLLAIHPHELAMLSRSLSASVVGNGEEQREGDAMGGDASALLLPPEEACRHTVAQTHRLLPPGDEGVHGGSMVHGDGECEGRAGVESEDRDCSRRAGRKGVDAGVGVWSEIDWGKILKSRVCWAIFVGHTTFNLSFYLLLTQLPSYYRLVVGLSGSEASYASALPYIVMCFTSIAGGLVADRLIASGRLTTSTTRKLMQTSGLLGSSLWLVASGEWGGAGAGAAVSVACVTGALATAALANAGYSTNYMEVGGRSAGLLLSVGNTLASLPGMIAPVVTGVIVDAYNCTDDEADRVKCEAAYRVIFLLVLAVNCAGALFYAAFTDSRRLM